MKASELARMMDHTLLKPDGREAQVRTLCAEAAEHGFCTVCINPYWAPLCRDLLANSSVKVCTVAGFPLGAAPVENKVFETAWAIQHGATEVDMVINVGALKDGRHAVVRDDVAALAHVCHDSGALLKVILETCLLTDEEKKTACALCVEARADFVKTSTGMSTGGATVADVALMSQAVRAAGLGVKAAGGIRTYPDALAMIAAGATRIGCSASVAILQAAAEAAAVKSGKSP